MNVLIVVDMQNDFIDGALGTKEACELVPKLAEQIKNFDGLVLATRDTHGEDYLDTMEGKKLPVVHCVKGTEGWELHSEIVQAMKEQAEKRTADKRAVFERTMFDKPTFGSIELGQYLEGVKERGGKIDCITLAGVCTDICVISNAMICKAAFPEASIIVHSDCCAGVTPESHRTALAAMDACQIEIR